MWRDYLAKAQINLSAAERYIDAMSKLYPDRASDTTAGPGNEGTVYMPFPDDDDLDIES